MPRAKKQTLSGDPALPAVAPKGVPYGEGERALESQRRAPMPNRQATNAIVPAGGGGGQAPAVDPRQAAMAMEAPTSMIDMPTERPDEAITEGMYGNVPQPNEALYELKALVRQYPYPDLINLLARIDAEM